MKPEVIVERKILVYKATNEESSDIVIAQLQQDVLVEYQKISSSSESHLGDIRLGKIQKIQKNLQAAFVDIGEDKQAFLPLKAEQLDQYKNGQEVIVELKKAAVGNKGMAVTDQFSLRSQHVVLSYGNTLIGVSKKIGSEEERKRLKSIGHRLDRPEGIGFVLRTESEGCSEEMIREEACELLNAYTRLCDRARYSRVGETLYKEESSLSSELFKTPSLSAVDEIIVEDQKLYQELSEAIRVKRLPLDCVIRSYDGKGISLSTLYKVETQLEQAYRKRVNLSGGILSGGYLFIEETEALNVVDVNSGKELTGTDKEAAVTAFNIACCETIARQIRLRNLSGIIVIDFIDMEKDENKRAVMEAMEKAMSSDPRVHTIVDFTKLNLLEMTRARKGLSLSGN